MSGVPSLPADTDVAIVGGGIMGASIAYFLTEADDLEVTVLERRNIASGSTGDSSAIIRHHYGQKEIYTKLAWWSHGFFRAFEDRVGQPIAYRQCPRVIFAEEGSADAAYAEAGHDVLAAHDIPVARYEGDELRERFPMLELDGVDFAVSDEQAAYSDGNDVAAGFARAAQERGATVVTGVTVDGFDIEDGAISAVRTDDGTVACDDIVLAAGPWTPGLAPELGVDVPVTPSAESVIILDPPDRYREKYPSLAPVTGFEDGDYYIRADFGGGVLVSTHHTGGACEPGYRRQPQQDTLMELYDVIDRYVPELGDAGIQGRYTGVYSNTPDHDFILDQAGPDGCYLACGFSGHGFKHAPAVGKIMTDLVVSGETDLVDRSFFALSRFDDDPAGHGWALQY